MDKELENRPDIMPGDAGIDHEPENAAADEISEFSHRILLFPM